jgi:SAM-dependent methyltransferase
MNGTSFVRKSVPTTKLWKPDYLTNTALERDLSKMCGQLHGRLLDLGCGNSPYRSLLTNVLEYVAYDIDAHGSTPQVVGVAEKLPFMSDSFDSILSTQVLEHVRAPWNMVEEIARVLAPGGQLILSAPQSWRLHEEPYDYYRFTSYGLKHLLERVGLRVIECVPQGGTWLHVGQIITNTIWKAASPRFSPSWWTKIVATSVVNISFGIIDELIRDPSDTTNYIILARKTEL